MATEKNNFQRYRLVLAPNQGTSFRQAAILIRNSLRYKGLQSLGPRVVIVEIMGTDGSIVAISAYLRHTSGEGLADLTQALH